MSITKFAFKNNRLFYLLLFAIIVMGIWRYIGFPSQEDPTFTIREAVVTAYYPGMSSERVENLITRKLEEKIREIPEVEFIKSSSKTELSVIHVTVGDKYFNMQSIWDKLRNKMDEAKAELPSGTQGPVVNDDYGDVTIASLALTADGFSPSQMYDTAVEIRRELYTVPGVKQVNLYGVQHEAIYLEFSNVRLAEFGLTPQLLAQSLSLSNKILPGGKIEVMGRHIVIEPSGSFTSVDDLNNAQIFIPGHSESIYLRDIVNVRREYIDPPQQLAYSQGEPAIIIGISMAEGQNILEVSKALRNNIKALENTFPIGYQLRWVTFQSDHVEVSISDFSSNLYQTLAIVLLVVILFLGLRTGLIVGLGVPVTMLLTILVMYYAHISMQRVSIAALIISLGLLVDNGIVVAEDIKRRLQEGSTRFQAAIAAGNSLAMPLLTSSLTTILAFVPLVLAEHRAGEYTYSIAQVVSIALIASWFLSITVTPLLCARFIDVKVSHTKETYDSGFYLRYRAFLDWVLTHRFGFLSGMVILMLLSVQLLSQVPRQFFPPSDRAQYTIYLDLGRGASIHQTREATSKLTHWLLDKKTNPSVTNTVAYVGEGGPRFFLSLSPFDPDPNRAFILVDLKTSAEVEDMIAKTQTYVLQHLPQVHADVKTLFLGPSETGVVQVRIVGPNQETLYQLAQQLKLDLHHIPGVVAIEDDWGNKTMGVTVDIQQSMAGRSSVTPTDVALSMNAFYSGYQITDYRERDKIIPIVLRADQKERNVADRMKDVNVYSQATGAAIPLTQIADLKPQWQFGHIKRRNFEPTITVSARHPELYASQLKAQLLPYLNRMDFPKGYRYEWGGELEDAGKAQKALFAHLPLCLILAFVLLVWEFNSYVKPAIVFMTIPLLMIGGTLGMVIMHATLGFVAILGFLSLGGIIVNNAIVLLDRMQEELNEGLPLEKAIIAASLMRFRPILMTTMTTVLGLVPLILFGGEMWYGMATVIAFGLTVGTVLTLGVVPVLALMLMDDSSNTRDEAEY